MSPDDVPPVTKPKLTSPASSDCLYSMNHEPHPAGIRRQSSFSNLLHKLSTDQQHFADFLEEDACSIVSVESAVSEVGNMSRPGSFADLKDAAAVSRSHSLAGTAPQQQRKPDGVAAGRKLSQAVIWNWLTTSKQTLHEEQNIGDSIGSGASTPTNTTTSPPPPTTAATMPSVEGIKDTQLRSRMRTYAKYYRDLNATSPNNW